MIERYDQLVAQGRDAAGRGDLEAAESSFAAAEKLAREHGDDARADRAEVSRRFVSIERGEADAQIAPLRMLFMRNADTEVRSSAAYAIAVAHDDAGDLAGASDWAARSSELADQTDDEAAVMRSLNLHGVLALRTATFDVAETAFQRVLTTLDLGGHDLDRANAAQARDNLGYVHLCTGRLADGLRLCETARETLEELGATQFLHETLQDLCYGYILDDQLERATECGERALELALAQSDQLIVKNCLFLLSEIAVRRGDTFRARRYLRELTAYYPEVGVSEEIIDVFLQTDLTTVVNLRG
jgi:tetratricopeptide (TPR) repeat protein